MTIGIVAIGISVAVSYLEKMQLPDPLPVLVPAAVLSFATVVASLIPTPRAPHAWTRYRRSRGTRKPTTRGE